jgi:hypothetical protein
MRKLLLLVPLVAGCKWTDFDDLADSTWVKSTTKPNNDSANWGVAVARGLRTGTGGGALVVLGTGEALYTELTFDANGNSSVAPNEIKLNNEFAIASLADQPLLLADPESDDVSLVVGSGGNSIAVLTGTGTLTPQQVPNQPNPDGATYLKFDAAKKPQPIVGAGTKVFGVDTGSAAQHECSLADNTAQTIAVAALGAGKVNATTDQAEKLVVWTKTGKLLVYEPTVWSGCTSSQLPVASAETGFSPGTGAQIFTIKNVMGQDTTFVVLAARKSGSGGGLNDLAARIMMYDLSTSPPTMVGAPLDKDGLHGMAVASFDDGQTHSTPPPASIRPRSSRSATRSRKTTSRSGAPSPRCPSTAGPR